MDELLDVLDLLGEFGLEGVMTLVLRIIGVLAILGGVSVWLFTDLSLFIPVILIVGGLLLVTIPGLLFEFIELAG
ncbi:hypothetical protein [Halostella sp. PRR32]|uniref:hypothetical protein n=1 Tax=Halostella sp. PRR32 TaxID=3098147 RepID=UPI002B1E03FB|nr:hypothetical protein [Halostella sp. PRR32]